MKIQEVFHPTRTTELLEIRIYPFMEQTAEPRLSDGFIAVQADGIRFNIQLDKLTPDRATTFQSVYATAMATLRDWELHSAARPPKSLTRQIAELKGYTLFESEQGFVEIHTPRGDSIASTRYYMADDHLTSREAMIRLAWEAAETYYPYWATDLSEAWKLFKEMPHHVRLVPDDLDPVDAARFICETWVAYQLTIKEG